MTAATLARRAARPGLVIAAARAWLGTPYHDQASRRGAGCDCLGLARGVWRDVVGAEPAPVPPYSRDWGEGGPVEVLAEAARAWMIEVPVRARAPGDLVLFRMRRGAVAKHCAILTAPHGVSGRARFIHAYERTGVVEEVLTHAWARRIAFALRYPREHP